MRKFFVTNKLIFLILLEFIYLIVLQTNFNDILNRKDISNFFTNKKKLILFEKKIKETFQITNHANLNEIESSLPFGRKWKRYNFSHNAINVGSSLDPQYIPETIITTVSIIISQKSTTKLRLHYSVVNNFNPRDMIKIYTLRNRLREDVEFNFYNASRVEKELNTITKKGPGLAAKLLLPQLTDNSVKKLIILDNGDVLTLRDLSIMYNWKMGNNIYMGAPDESAGMFGKISNKTLEVYINVGNYLIDVQKVKKMNMYNLFLKYKNVYSPPLAEQNMINDIAFGRIGYLPVEFGLVPPYSDDKLFYLRKKPKARFASWNLKIIGNKKYFLPKRYNDFLLAAFDPVIVHQWNGKWAQGNGMNIYRKLCQYFIELSGMKKEICNTHPGYCKLK